MCFGTRAEDSVSRKAIWIGIGVVSFALGCIRTQKSTLPNVRFVGCVKMNERTTEDGTTVMDCDCTKPVIVERFDAKTKQVIQYRYCNGSYNGKGKT